MENSDFIKAQKFLESKGFLWEKDKDCLWAEETVEIKLKDLFALMDEYKVLSQANVIKSVCNHIHGSIIIKEDIVFAECKLCGELY